MPPSQLKRLKASLREQGITGPQKSKKQKKAAKGAKSASDRSQRNAALQQIRDSFNPFEIKAPSRPAKFQHANSPSLNGAPGKGVRYKDVLHRPGVTKSAGEEMRRATLLPELQRRHKTGGLVDRRIGEGDPGMTTEERAVQRFAQEKQRKKAGNLFDLEASDDDEPKVSLTHGGRTLDELPEDDFGEDQERSVESEDEGDLMQSKRRHSDLDATENGDMHDEHLDDEPERKKSKREVMQEVVAKSKLLKYERQKTKEDDDDLREELDQGMDAMLAFLRGQKSTPKPVAEPEEPKEPVTNGAEPIMNPDRLKLLNGMDRAQVGKEYDTRLRQMAQDQRAKPSERTKTEEEQIKEEAQRLKDLEERRTRRMRGERLSDDEEERPEDAGASVGADNEDSNEAAEFGFANSHAPPTQEQTRLVLEDEDEFALDEDLVASGSDVDFSGFSEDSQDSDDEVHATQTHDDEEDEFVKGILGEENPDSAKADGPPIPGNRTGLAYTYPCPRSHQELLDLLKDTSADHLPTMIQRIRALHHPSLNATNKEAVGDFSAALVDHLSYMGIQQHPLTVIEQVIRHLHSLSRTYPEVIAKAFRNQLQAAHERKDLHAGDLMILTAIGSIYPTSDHFHQVVTPAMTIMARWLAMTNPDTAHKHSTGVFLVALCIKYQRLSKRYIPEAVRFTFRALSAKSKIPDEAKKAHLDNLASMIDLWKDKLSFTEIFQPFLPLLENKSTAKRNLQILLQQSHTRRRPLELHHHRPLAIRTSVPKFEDDFHPDKHYDPDAARAEANKLQKEYKRERKGALRELRKDANFVARHQLAEKKERDREYDKKYRRLVAEIQGDEGREKGAYEREKAARKRKGR